MRMRTALAAAVLGSAALLGSVGTAVADEHGDDMMGGGSQVTQSEDSQGGNSQSEDSQGGNSQGGNRDDFSAGWLWGGDSATTDN